MPEYDNSNKGALWWKKDNSDKNYQNGKVNVNGVDYWISVFKNTHKQEGSKQPDFNITLKKV